MSNEENQSVEEKDLSNLSSRDMIEMMNLSELPKDSELFKKGFVSLLEGYVDYAQEVLVNRAVPDLRDGLKPVQRFALWALHKSKSKDFQKSSVVSSDILKYHPHNEDSAYESLARMTDSNGSFRIPLLKGSGNLGKFFSSSPPSAKRYTNVKLHDNAKEIFASMDGIEIIPNFDATEMVAEVLPTSFPLILCKSADGIAVGFSTNIPSFTVNDVCGLVEEYLTEGELKTKIVPDFATGGYIAPSERELDKLMRTGKGKFVVRGKVEIDGKNINVREVPHGTTVQKLEKEIEKYEINGVSRVTDLSGLKNGCTLEITCKAKNRVDETLVELYNKTSLQHNFNSNLIAIQDKKLVMTGVWGIIERWVDWRRGVLAKQFKKELEKAEESIQLVEAFVKLLDKDGAKDEVVELATRKSDSEAIDKVIEHVGCSYDIAKWIISRRLNQFRNGDKYRTQYEDLKQVIDGLKHTLNNLDEVILADMKRVKSTIGASDVRKTEISQSVYKQGDNSNKLEEESVYQCYYEIKNGFIKKTSYMPADDEASTRMLGKSNSVIITISNYGEIYRIYGNDLEMSSTVDIGTYIPTYAGIKDASSVEILWGTIADGAKHVLTYQDGFVGFLDTEEFLEGTIKSRYMRNGISDHAHLLTDVREYQSNATILVETSSGKLALAYLDSIKQKSRTARTRVWKSDEIYDSIIIPMAELHTRIPSYEKLLSKKPVEFNGKIDLTVGDSNLVEA